MNEPEFSYQGRRGVHKVFHLLIFKSKSSMGPGIEGCIFIHHDAEFHSSPAGTIRAKFFDDIVGLGAGQGASLLVTIPEGISHISYPSSSTSGFL